MPRNPWLSITVSVPRGVHGVMRDVVAQRTSSAPDELGRLGAELERIEQEDPEFGRQVRDRWTAERKVGSMVSNVYGNAEQVVVAQRIEGGITFHNR